MSATPRLRALELPPAAEMVGFPVGSVIVPAHNEEALIEDTLRRLEPMSGTGEIDLVVAGNGCTDATLVYARRIVGARVLDLSEPSKAGALNAADAIAQRWPRLYLDADIAVTPAAVRAVFAELSEGRVLAARPCFRYDLEGASWPVRSYYRARQRLPETAEHLWGAGAYAVSRDGHGRFAAFPDVVADDFFVDSLFAEDEKIVVDTNPVVVRTPRDLPGLMATMRRTYRGNAELMAEHHPAVRPAKTTPRMLRDLLTSATSPSRALDAAIYFSVVVSGRLYARKHTRAGLWERDDSSRRRAAA